MKTSRRRSKSLYKGKSGREWRQHPFFSQHRSVSGAAGLLKRSMDVALSAAALVLLSPVMAVIALAIRLADGGPVFYRQVRVGLDGEHFVILKFRTMHPEAEAGLGAIWSVPDDPRCTRFGGLLRRLGLDELPQLWNVLCGDMSLVGPRPERPELIRQFRKEYPGYERRHAVRSGITGYAQVHGWRGFSSLEERLRHDFYYIEHWSLLLDLYIAVLTLLRGWSEKRRDGALS